jgi:hypothetical protein
LVVLCTSVLLFFHGLSRGGECCSGDLVSLSEDENSEQKLEVSTSSSAVNAVTLIATSVVNAVTLFSISPISLQCLGNCPTIKSKLLTIIPLDLLILPIQGPGP